MIKFKLKEGVILPKYESELACGFDVTAFEIVKVFRGDIEIIGDKLNRIKEGFIERGFVKIRPFERILFDTGLTLADISENIELQIRSRSGLALKNGLCVFNQPGTIDPDYRGMIGIIIANLTPFLNKIERFDRIAQIVPCPKLSPYKLEESDLITKSNRGNNGFGSTGK